MISWQKVVTAATFLVLCALFSNTVAPMVRAESVEQFNRKGGMGPLDNTTTFTIQYVVEVEQQLARLRIPSTPIGDYAIVSTTETLYLDRPLNVSTAYAPAEDLYAFTLFFGVKHKPRQRLKLVCRNASTALNIRGSVAIGNLDISNCTESGVVVELPTPEHQVDMLFFSLHDNTGQNGAGLRVVTGGATLNYMDISYNRASGNGGGLFVGINGCVEFSQLNHGRQRRFNFTHNWGERKGGAMYLDHSNCKFASNPTYSFYVRDALFANNTAQQAGGAVYVINGTPVLQEPAAQLSDLQTKAVDLGFVQTDFIGNKAVDGTGGAIHVAQFQSILMLEDVLFSSNAAAMSGGALWAASSLHGLVKISSAVFTENKAGPIVNKITNSGAADPREGTGCGGGMYLTGSLTVVFQRGSGVSFTHNSATAEGGAIHCAFCSSLYISGVTFSGNSAAAGGAVCMDHVSLSSLINDNRFVGNVAACPGALLPGGSSSSAAPAADVGAGAKGYTCGCGGGGAVCIRSVSSVELSGSAFLNNSAYAGGALYINQDDCLLPVGPPCGIRIVNHTFTSNSAEAAGGAIYLAAPFKSSIPLANLSPSPDSITSFPDTRFEPPLTPACESVVKAHTASFKPSPTPPSKGLNTFTNNTILGTPGYNTGYGPDIATAVACMLRANTMLPQTSPSSGVMREVAQPHVVAASGDSFSLLLRSYDAYGQLISWPLPHVSYTATVTGTAGSNSSGVVTSSVSMTGPTQSLFNPSLRCLDVQNLSLFSTNYTFYNLTISAVVSSLQPVAHTFVTVQLRSCCVGQVATGRSCKSCLSTTARNQYSFNPQNQTCDRCPSRAVCGGSTLIPMDGYWHASPRSDKLYKCPVHDACASPGRVTTLEGLQQQLLGNCGQPGLDPVDVRRYSQVQCRWGYGGNVCGNCQHGGQKMYGRKGQVCSTCSARWRSFLAFVMLKLCEGAFVACLVLARTKKTKRSPLLSSQTMPSTMTNPILRGTGTGVGRGCGLRQQLIKLSAEAATYLAALLEVLVVHVQVLGLLVTVQIGWPTHLLTFFNALRFHEASSIWMSPDCLLPLGASNVAFWRISIITLSPSGTMVLPVVAWLCFIIIRNRWSNAEQQAEGLPLQTATAIAIAYSTFYYPSIINTIMSVFTCMPLDRPNTTYEGLPSIAGSHHGWWKQDYNMRCFTGPHLVFSLAYGLPFLLFFAVGVPLFITYFLWRHRSKGMLSDAAFQAKFGYMYADFRDSCWFWFSVRFWLLLALSAAVQGLSYYGPLRQLITVALCLSLVLLLQLGFKPYQSQLVNSVYAAMLYSVLVTVYLSFAYATPSSTAHLGTMWAVIVLNAGVVAMQLAIIAGGLVGMRTAVAGKTNAVLYDALMSMKSAVLVGSLSAYSRLVVSHRSGNGPLAGAGDSAA